MANGNGTGNGKRNGNAHGAGKGPPAALRCAIYTRKSTAIGLEQEFNSLDAQREACEGYIKSQAANRWEALPEGYNDGGFTGANLERPAFQRLLADIEAGKIDIVVVYKVDRLSRSLLDFAQVMDFFSRRNVAFVSVTQSFSTSDSIGKLTLALLMTFAAFERDMISERTRDKIAAARRRGKWTGGSVPLGYEVKEKHLVVNELEAVRSREIFELYLQHGSALAVSSALNQAGHKTKRHEARNGKVREARPWNKAYLLRGILKCGLCGRALTAASNRRNGREYRYYRCVTYSKGGKTACRAASVPAGPIEEFVVERMREIARKRGLADDVKMELDRKVRTHRTELTRERTALLKQIDAHGARVDELAQLAVEASGVAQRLAALHLASEESTLRDLRGRLAEVERQVAALAQVEEEYSFVDRVLREFDAVWDAMTPENRNRLVHALVREVVYNDQAGDIRVELVDVRDPVGSLERRRKTGGMQKNRTVSGQTPITMGEADASGGKCEGEPAGC